ncbi:MAG TPA: SH3 domain-containing protein [Kofleriaceae bacterium]|nr:SH3 domain-containing protein [Kofleriaceae bacterium]
MGGRSGSIAVALVLGLALGAAPASAERLTILRRTAVLERPREPSAAVMVVEPGLSAKVLQRHGDWVKVRVAGEVGWVRTSWIGQREGNDDEAPLEERVADTDGAAVEDDEDPVASGDADADDDGDDGDDDDDDDDDATDAEVEAEEDPALRGPRGKVAASAALGLRQMTGRQRSDGAMALGSYDTETRAYAIAVGVDVAVKRWDALYTWVSARYQGSMASPGTRYALSEEIDGTVPFTMHEIDAGGRAGYLFGPLLASARLGYHVELFRPARLENVALVPGEVLTGVTIGVAIELPFTGSGWSARGSVDRLMSGKRGQTPGLSDGEPVSVEATWAGLVVGYAVSAHYAAELTYGVSHETTRFRGLSARQPDVMSVERTDAAREISLGIRHAF